jgi:WD40 repeat protein
MADGARILLRTGQRTYILNPETGQTVLVFSPAGATDIGPALLWEQNDRYIASLQKGNLLAVWDTITGAKIATIHLPADMAYFSWLPDGRHINVVVTNGPGQLYDAITGRLLISYLGDVAILSEDGRFVASGDNLPDTKHGGVLKSIVQVLEVRLP